MTIIFRLINRKQNEEFLKTVPHRKYLDMAIVYYLVTKIDEQSIHSIIVKNDIAKKLGMTEKELFLRAFDNTRKILPPTVETIANYIKKLIIELGIPECAAETMIDEDVKNASMWVISNEEGINGACSILYEDTLFNLAVKLESNLYILPSSLHECIAVPEEDGEPYELMQMVEKINREKVALDDRLSNQVYFYNKDKRKLSIVND
jgi:hypothetical protein